MGRIFKEYLSGNRVYSCNTCKAHLALHEDIISKVPEPLFCIAELASLSKAATAGPICSISASTCPPGPRRSAPS